MAKLAACSPGGDAFANAGRTRRSDGSRAGRFSQEGWKSTTMNQATLPQGVKVKTVAELTREIKGVLEEGFPEVWVSGQISNYRPASSGHFYFTLKDADAQLP